MIIIGIVLLSVGLLASLIAFRGRVVQRGQFCRKCRFDLAGLDIEADGAKCPECGREIHHESARRPLIRKRSRVGLGVATILFLAGGGGIWAGATGKTGSIITAMPDPIVLWLTDLGVDEALDELVVRVSKVPSTMSARSWDRAIEMGLAFQADTALVWDVRWGEVLFQGLIQSRMNDAQLKQYFVNADEIELTVRDRVHPGASGFGYMLEWEPTRSGIMTFGTVDYQLNRLVKSYGVQGEEPIWTRDPDNRSASFPLRFSSHTGPSRGRSTTWKMHEYFAQEPGNAVDVYFDYEMTLVPLGETEPIFTHAVREEFVIQIVDEDEPIVQTYADEAAARRVVENIGIRPIRTMLTIEDENPNRYTTILTTTLVSDVSLAPLSLGMFLLVDGQEYEVGKITVDSYPMYGGFIYWSIKPGDEQSLSMASAVHAKLIQSPFITVVFRTNPEFVKNNPGIDRVLDITFVFEDVPIEIVESSVGLSSLGRESAQSTAYLIEE